MTQGVNNDKPPANATVVSDKQNNEQDNKQTNKQDNVKNQSVNQDKTPANVTAVCYDFVLRSDLAEVIKQISDMEQRMQQNLSTISDQRIQLFQNELYASMRTGYTELGDRIDSIRQSTSSTCDNDLTNDVSNVILPQAQAEVLNVMRVTRADAYAKLADAASKLASGDPLSRSALIVQLADTLLADTLLKDSAVTS